MLNKSHNSIVTLAAVFLALVGVSKPAKAFLLAQANVTPTTFAVPDKLPAQATIKMSTSNSTSSINQSLKESFTDKFPEAEVNIETKSSGDALQALSEGEVDLVGIGRNLTVTEKQKGFVAVPISREKIAVVVSQDNPYDGNLTISQFAQIFRGEITDWSEIGGQPGAISLVDAPEANDTRQAFPSYPVFRDSEFATGSNAVQLDQDSTDEMIAQLGANGISYAIANDVINRDDVKIVTMHQTQPDDERYPFSQPFYLVYQGTPNEVTQAFLGFATSQGGEQVVANRVGSMSTAAATAIASKLANNAPVGEVNLPVTTVDGEGNLAQPDIDGDDIATDVDAEGVDVGDDTAADVDTEGVDVGDDTAAGVDTEGVDAEGNSISQANLDLEDSGETNPNLEGSGETNPNLEGSGETNPNLEGSGEVNPDLEDSGETNPNLEGSGEVNPDFEDRDQPNTAIDTDGNAEVIPNAAVSSDEGEGAVATAKKGKWWWWLPLILGIPILAAIAVSGFGGNKKSDQEPAVGGIPDGDNLNGGSTPNIPDGGDLSAVGANAATSIGNAAENAVNTTSKMGGAAIATGSAAAIGGTAAAANFVGKRKATTNDIDDIDIRLDDSDDTELSDGAFDDAVVEVDEIPSNPVNEFTGQETKLQLTDQPTKLQTDIVDDTSKNTSGLMDGISNTGSGALAGGAAAIGGAAAAASGFFNREDSLDADVENSTIDDENTAFTQTGFVSEQTTKLQTDDLDLNTDTGIADESAVEAEGTFETQTSQEFKGDFVLDEEPTREFFTDANQDIEEIDLDTDVSGNLGDIETNVSNFSTDAISDIQAPEIDTDVEDTEINTSGLLDGISNTGSGAVAGGAAAIGGAAAAASGFFNRDRTESSEIKEIDPNTDISSDFSTDRSFADNVIGDAEATSENLDISLDEITFDDIDNSINASLEELSLDSTEESTDINLDEITFDDIDNSINASLEETSLDSTEEATDINLDDIIFDDINMPKNISLDDINFDDTEDGSIDNVDIDNNNNVEISLDDLGFDESDDDNSDLLSGNVAKINDLSEDDRSNDMNNISTWLDSLETPNQNSEDISGWLDQLNVQNNDSESENTENQETVESEYETEYETEDISFQFLEDLLERDSNSNKDNS